MLEDTQNNAVHLVSLNRLKQQTNFLTNSSAYQVYEIFYPSKNG